MHDQKKTTALVYSDWGLKNFKPWYVSNLNSGKNDDFAFLMLNLLKKTNNCLQKKRYWFFRGDCNVYKMWMKVNFGTMILLVVCFISLPGLNHRFSNLLSG